MYGGWWKKGVDERRGEKRKKKGSWNFDRSSTEILSSLSLSLFLYVPFINLTRLLLFTFIPPRHKLDVDKNYSTLSSISMIRKLSHVPPYSSSRVLIEIRYSTYSIHSVLQQFKNSSVRFVTTASFQFSCPSFDLPSFDSSIANSDKLSSSKGKSGTAKR